ncbi:MAG: VWA domain-containing protein [Elusimicrobia bacterium]|nr:VWA domain-containing protein [Elusimicrobiota bacterium]MBD3411520.1 VWA domain-containing protein [Elusimicrobiota bacterium]
MLEFSSLNLWIIGGILLSAGGIIFYFVSGAGRQYVFLRVLVYILLVVLLLQPVRVQREAVSGKPVLAVLIDNSKSMGVKDPDERLIRVKEFIRERIDAWNKKADVRIYLFSRTTALTSSSAIDSWKPVGSATHIGHALSEIAQEHEGNLSAILVISDGVNNGIQNPETVAQEINLPVFTIGVGNTGSLRDILIADLEASEFAFKNTPMDIRVTVRGYGFENTQVPVRLYSGSSLVATREAVIPSDGIDDEIRFTINPKNVGTFSYTVKIPRYADEISDNNNSVEFTIDVIREKLRILYICGQPGYEYALLREVLKSDPAVELVSFVILRNPGNVSFVGDHELSLIPFPAREIFLEKLFSFDLLIFENFTWVRFGIIQPYLQNIKRFIVEKGGSFIMIGGPNSFGMGAYQTSPLEEILPVVMNAQTEEFKLDVFRLKINQIQHPIMHIGDTRKLDQDVWNTMPPLVGYNTIGPAKPGARVLAEHPDATINNQPIPIVTVWDKGNGRVMSIASNTTWRWAMGLASKNQTPFNYIRFWRGAVRWLTKAEEMKLVLLTFDKRQYVPGETMRISVMVKDEAYDPLPNARVNLQVIRPNGQSEQIPTFPGAEGVYHAEYESWDSGRFRFKVNASHPRTNRLIGSDERSVTVQAFSPETVELNLNEDLLKRIAAVSGGAYYGIDRFEDSRIIKALTTRKRGDVISRKPVWSNPVIFILIIIFLLVEWYLRRRKGLA